MRSQRNLVVGSFFEFINLTYPINNKTLRYQIYIHHLCDLRKLSYSCRTLVYHKVRITDRHFYKLLCHKHILNIAYTNSGR